MDSAEEALSRAIRAIGGISATARLCNVRPPTVFNWPVAPPHHCPAIENATGISCEELRPDLDWVRDSNDDSVIGHLVRVNKPNEDMPRGRAQVTGRYAPPSECI